MWTQFWDMHSGGSQKEKFSQCFIEAPEKEAKIIFYNRFGHNPERVTCTCCGEDYSTSEYKTLKEATAFQRNCAYVYTDRNGNEVKQDEAWVIGKGLKKGYNAGYVERADKNRSYAGEYLTLSEYVKHADVCVIYAKDIKNSERIGEVPEQGYIWVD